MYSAVAGAFVLLSIGILMAHAMEGYWLGGRRVSVMKDARPLIRRPLARDHRRDAPGSRP